MSNVPPSNLPGSSDGRPEESDAKKNRRRVGFYAIWGNRFYSLYSLLFGKTSVTLGLLAAGGLTTAAIIEPTLLPAWMRGGKPVPVTTQKWADSSVVFTVDGKDKAGRTAIFDVIVLNKDYVWRRGSETDLLRGDQPMVGNDLDTYIFRPDVRSGLARASEVIAVGVASQEGGVDGETLRAVKRAETGAGWLRIILGPSARVSTLNLGQYRATCVTPDVGDTSWQRPFIMVGVRAAQPEVNLNEALADAFTGKTNLPSPECYSKFELARAP